MWNWPYHPKFVTYIYMCVYAYVYVRICMYIFVCVCAYVYMYA